MIRPSGVFVSVTLPWALYFAVRALFLGSVSLVTLPASSYSSSVVLLLASVTVSGRPNGVLRYVAHAETDFVPAVAPKASGLPAAS
ncbi:hypothetical protein [Flindersiella endophytica]